MKYSLQKRISAFVLAFALVMTTAFNSIGATTKADAAAAKVKTLYLTKKVTSATVGDSFTAQWAVKATKASKAMAKVTVKSDDPSVVKVTKITQSKKAGTSAKKAKKTKGTATLEAVGAGEAKITITTVKKTKKKKKLSKSFTVNVAAKETPASSETPVTPSGDASKDPAPKLESLVITADTTEIGPGGQAQLSVKAANEVGLASVTYESSNTYIATVDANGKVTGQNASTSPVTITVTAKDAAGNEAKGTIQIKVITLADAKITLADDSKDVSLVVDQTKKINATVDPSGYTLTYKDYDESIISVSADGTITAKKAGKTTVTVGAAGTNGTAVVTVTVKATSISIVKAYASKANQVTVVFSGNLTDAEKEALDVSLTYGSKQEVTCSFDASGNAILTKASNFAKGKYTAAIKAKDGKSIALDNDASKLSYEFEIDDIKATSIEIKPSQTLPWGSAVKVRYAVKDQYGSPMKDQTPDKLSWRLSCPTNSELKFTGDIFTATNKMVDDDANYPTYITVDFAEIKWTDTTNKTTEATILVDASLVADYKVAAPTGSVKLKSLQITDITVNPFKNASGEALVINQNDTADQVFKIKYDALDESGNKVDLNAYTAYSNALTFNVSGYNTVSNSIVTPLQFNKTGVTTDKTTFTGTTNSLSVIESDAEANAQKGLTKYTYTGTSGSYAIVNDNVRTGEFWLFVPKGTSGKFQVVGYAGSKSSAIDVEVRATATVDSVEWKEPGKSYTMNPTDTNGITVPLVFKDQYGKEIEAPTREDFNSNFSVMGQITGKLTATYAKDAVSKVGSLTITTDTAAKNAYELYVFKNTDNKVKSGIITINVGDAATAKNIVLVKATTASEKETNNIIVKESKKIAFKVTDQYESNFSTAKDVKYIATVNGAGLSMKYNNVAYTAGNDAAAVTAGSASAGEYAKGDLYSEFDVTGESATGNTDVTVSLQLYVGTTAVGDPHKFTFKVIPAPKAFKVKVVDSNKFGVTENGKTYIPAGSKVDIEVSAYDAAKDGKVITNYSGKANNAKVTEYYVKDADDKYDDVKHALTYEAPQFVNGVMTLKDFTLDNADKTLGSKVGVVINGIDAGTVVVTEPSGTLQALCTAGASSDVQLTKASSYSKINVAAAAKGTTVALTFADLAGNKVDDLNGKNIRVQLTIKNAAGTDVTSNYVDLESVAGKTGGFYDGEVTAGGMNITVKSLDADLTIEASYDGKSGSVVTK